MFFKNINAVKIYKTKIVSKYKLNYILKVFLDVLITSESIKNNHLLATSHTIFLSNFFLDKNVMSCLFSQLTIKELCQIVRKIIIYSA